MRSSRRPLVKTTRRELKPVEIVRGIGDEVVVRVLDETRLHRVNRRVDRFE